MNTLLELSVNDPDCLVWLLLDGPVVGLAMHADPDLLALRHQVTEHLCLLLGVDPSLVELQHLETLALLDHDSAAGLKDIL